MPSPVQHRFIAIDEGLGTLLHVDERDSGAQWRVPLDQPHARDMQLIGDHRIMVSHHRGFAEFDIHSGKKLHEYAAFEGVTAARRQADGSTLLAGVNLAGETGVTLLTLSPAPACIILRRVTCGGDYVRLIRQTSSNTCLLMCDGRIRETNLDGDHLADFPIEGFQHTWKAVRLPNRHIIASAGYGAFMTEFDAAGKIVRKFGARDQVPAAVNPYFYAMFQLLPGGHIVVANWQGHDAGHGDKGVQLLEFAPDGSIAWQWRQPPSLVSSLQGVLVLDELDTALLHDERDGLMQPLA